MTMSTTGLVITIAVICIGIYDLVCVLRKGTGSSVSDWLIKAGFKSPIIVFTFGFVCGHLFGYMQLEAQPCVEAKIAQTEKNTTEHGQQQHDGQKITPSFPELLLLRPPFQ